MIIVITMAGIGKRFLDAGYTVPKYRIEVHGKTLFDWSMESLKAFRRPQDSYIFVVREADDASAFIRESCVRLGMDCREIIELEGMTDGQATSALLAGDYWEAEEPLLVYNIDTYVEAYEMRPEQMGGDGFIPCFPGEGDHWSFVRLGGDGRAVEVREKTRVSENCTVGAYYFRSCSLYEQMYREYYGRGGAMEKGEKYIAPLYNYMIGRGMEIRISSIPAEKVHVLGTPEELDAFRKEDGK